MFISVCLINSYSFSCSFLVGESLSNVARRKGTYFEDDSFMDPSLSEEGFKQAKSLSKISFKWNIEHILVSPLQRSYQTADCIFTSQNISCSITPRIRELYLHEIENRIHSIETIKAQFSKLSLYTHLQLSSLDALDNTDDPEIGTYFNLSKENNKELPHTHNNNNYEYDDYMSGLLPIEGVLDYLYSMPYNNIAVVTHWGFLNGALKIPVIHNCDVYEVLLRPINPPPTTSASSSSFDACTNIAATGITTAAVPSTNNAGTTDILSPLSPTTRTSIDDTYMSVVDDDNMSRAEPGKLLIPVKVIRKRLIERVTHNI